MISESDIVSLTLAQLLDQHVENPQSFDYVGLENILTSTKAKLYMDNIVWQTKIELDGIMVDNPLNEPKTVIITYSSIEKSLTVRIFNRTFSTINDIEVQKCDASIEYATMFIRFNSNYRKYLKLKSRIFAHQQNKDSRKFLRKLSTVFPTIMDSHILGK